MNVQNKSLFSPVVRKIMLAGALVALVLIVLSGVIINLDKSISVPARTGEPTTRKLFSGLPEYSYIQAHSDTGVLPVKVTVPGTFSALPEFGYITAHSKTRSQTLTGLLPVGMRTLTEFGYIQAHTLTKGRDQAFSQVVLLPQGLLSLSEAGYITAHGQSSTETYTDGLPGRLHSQVIYGYLKMHE
jgi:hypothetical protein